METDATPIKIWSFKYHLHCSKKPFVDAIDALGHKKCYHISDEQRLNSIVKALIMTEQSTAKQKLVWEKFEDEKSFLLARGIVDANDNLLIKKLIDL